MEWLRSQNQGFQVGFTPDQVVPIVPGAAINDLRPGRDKSVRPGFDEGVEAVSGATIGPIDQGNVGVGAGAVSGGLKGGLGSASAEIAPGVIVAAMVVVDSVGTPVDTARACGLLAARYGFGDEFAGHTPPSGGCGSYAPPVGNPGPGNAGSVLGVVATNINLDKVMNQKVAEVAHDGVTRALGTAHGMNVGDTMFSISTDKVTPAVGVLPDCLHAAVRNTALGCQLLYQIFLSAVPEVVSRAIGHALLEAETVPGLATSYCDTFSDACASAAAAARTPTAGAAPAAPNPSGDLAAPSGDLAAPSGDLAAAASGSGRDLPWLAALLVGSACFAGAYALAYRRPAVSTARAARRRRAAAAGPRLPALRRVGLVAAAAGLAAVVVPVGAQSATITPADPECQGNATCLALVERIGEASKRAMARAITHAMVAAEDPAGGDSYCSVFPDACDAGTGGYPKGAGKTGEFNNITDVPGVRVGAYTDDSGSLGTTVLFMPEGGTAGVEVRGSAPGGRGTDAMRSDTSVQRVHALLLTGGSAYGLEAADGVVPYLEERGLGTPLPGGGVMPVVPTSVIFDLGRFGRPWTAHATAEYGAKAIAATTVGELAMGTVGGGGGAQTGGLKGGIGYASEDLGDGVIVGAMVNTNAFGTAVDDGNGCQLLGAAYQIGTEFGGLEPPPEGCGDYTGSPFNASTKAGENTTIGIVATNVPMSRPLLSKMAQYGQDGLAAALRPSHTYFDGDTIWAVSTGAAPAPAPAPTVAPSTPPVAAPPVVNRPPLPSTGGSWLVALFALCLGGSGALAGRVVRRRFAEPHLSS
jgi:L-aminopeptidase/D-esterase-like protein